MPASQLRGMRHHPTAVKIVASNFCWHTPSKNQGLRMIRRTSSLLLSLTLLGFSLLIAPSGGSAQTPATDVVLVLPFENRSNHTEYNWIGESFADSLAVLLNKPGLIVVTSDERAVAYQRLRLPLNVLPSRATTIKIAREVKASMIVIGTYNVTFLPVDPTAPAEKPPLANITDNAHGVPVH